MPMIAEGMFGIDLGSTTSSIAKLTGKNAIIIPNLQDNKDFLSSAVYIKKNGEILVGDSAKDRVIMDPSNGCMEFKSELGSGDLYHFRGSRRRLAPFELSAEVLKKLKNMGGDNYLYTAAIAVPTYFNGYQIKDIEMAARFAEISQELVSEPFAAAWAYGLNSRDNEIWMIYDFGGATFDVSLLKKDPDKYIPTERIPNHAGIINKGSIISLNNFSDVTLGGKLIDWDIVENIFVPAIIDEFGLDDFSRSNPKYIKHFAKLRKAAETVKIELSNSDMAEATIENFIITDDGEALDFCYRLERSSLDEIMKLYVDRSIGYCRKTLEDANLSESDVSKIVLVGGSTLSPYIHERLTQEFNIPLEFSLDPITVVARGAAIYAGTQTFVVSDRYPVEIELVYESSGQDIRFEVMGKLRMPYRSAVEDYSIEFIINSLSYRLGKIRVDRNGYFQTILRAEDETNCNIFEIKVYDANGYPEPISSSSPNTLKYKVVTSKTEDSDVQEKSAERLSFLFEKQKQRSLELEMECFNSKNQKIKELFKEITDIMEGIDAFFEINMLDDIEEEMDDIDSILDEIEKLKAEDDKWDKIAAAARHAKWKRDNRK